jgi:23S rRNA (adenine2030-N6)-methyltransferase
VQARDGYAAVKALLPPKEKRGFVLIDPPYEAQEEEYPRILGALATAWRAGPPAASPCGTRSSSGAPSPRS